MVYYLSVHMEKTFKIQYTDVIRQANTSLVITLPRKFIPEGVDLDKGTTVLVTIEPVNL